MYGWITLNYLQGALQEHVRTERMKQQRRQHLPAAPPQGGQEEDLASAAAGGAGTQLQGVLDLGGSSLEVGGCLADPALQVTGMYCLTLQHKPGGVAFQHAVSLQHKPEEMEFQHAVSLCACRSP